MTVFITGATGFVGSRLAAELVRRGEVVKALVRVSSKCQSLLDIGVELVVGDLLDFTSFASAVAGCDTVYHVASLYEPRLVDKELLYAVNVNGARNLFHAALNGGVSRVVYTSTCLTIGARRGELGSEKTAHRGDFLSDYERSKYLAEREALSLVEQGLPLVCVNPGGIYGPGDFKTLGRLITALCTGKPLFFLDGEVSLAYIDDVVQGHILAAEKGEIGQRYLIVGQNSTLSRVLAEAAGVSGCQYRPRPLPYWLAYSMATLIELACFPARVPPPLARSAVRTNHHGGRFDGTKAQIELGLTPTPLDEGLGNAVNWYRENGYMSRRLI